MQSRYSKGISILLASVVSASFMLGGCSDGKNGQNGADGQNAVPGAVVASSLSAEEQAKVAYTGEALSVTINGAPVVKFKVTDGKGSPVVGLGVRDTSTPPRLNNLKFALAKLVPGSNGSPSNWVSYIVTTSATPALGQRPSQDREGTLIDNGDGTYQYTFYRDITKVKGDVAALTDSGSNRKADLGDLTYDPALTHRLVIEYGGNVINTSPSIAIDKPMNVIYDFVPATGKVVTSANTQREVVTTAACNECHGAIGKTTPHGGRADTRYCSVCHTSQRAYGRAASTSTANVFTGSTYITDGEVAGDFVTMVHKIHMGNKLTKTGYNYAGVLFEKLGYPQDQGNCRKCHKSGASLQGDNWNLAPSRQACGSCHDGVNFATGAGHSLGNLVQPNDAICTSCHNAAAIKGYHMQVNKSVNNPETPAGMVNFTYEISSAAVNATTNDLTIKFRILGDTLPVTLVAPAAGVANSLAGFTGGPSFLLAYTMTQDGITTPADYNNLGKVAGQPVTVSIAGLLNTTTNAALGNITGPATDGTYTATILGTSTSAFPVGAKMRAVGLQGYYTQAAGTGGISANTARHTPSIIKAVTGDAVRRTVVDPEKCAQCHEFLDFHGGNRVFQTQLCIACHNPNLSTSGRTITDAKLSGYAFTAIQQAILISWDGAFNKATPGYSLLFPEFTNNFKEMIHGIHAGKDRMNPLRDVRNGSGTSITLINAGEFAYPNLLKNCESCHVTTPANTNKQTYKADLPAGVLASTNVTNNATLPVTIASKLAARNTVPNVQDIVNAPMVGACVSCHDSSVAKAHMASNGGQLGAALNGPSYTDLGTARNTVAIEQCALCHGEGKVADVVKVHAK